MPILLVLPWWRMGETQQRCCYAESLIWRKPDAVPPFKNASMHPTCWSDRIRRAGAALMIAIPAWGPAAPLADPNDLGTVYAATVDRRLELPASETALYGRLTEAAFATAMTGPLTPQYVLVVDRSPKVQAAMLLWREAAGHYRLIGASPVSTGRPGSFDHFETPLGVFDHTPDNPDFRAEGTFNANAIRGYGIKGMRVFDLGWQRAKKGWGDGAVMEMRLQMHATDPDLLEKRLGTPQSKGCIRIPASLNWLLDTYGLLDAEYERLFEEGRKLWVLQPHRVPVWGAGRYVVVVHSEREQRPTWARTPAAAVVRPAARSTSVLPAG